MSVSELFALLSGFSADELNGELTAIDIAGREAAPMRRFDQAEAVKSQGLSGDRYAKGKGYWRATGSCEVILVSAEELHASERRAGGPMQAGWRQPASAKKFSVPSDPIREGPRRRVRSKANGAIN